jgi:capsular polysaccharide transport system permease protein
MAGITGRHTLWQQFRTQCRVIGALLMREAVSHYGRSGIGTGWLFLEPLIFILPVFTLWKLVHNPYEHGVPLLELVWSGYLPILLFRHVGFRMLYFIRANSGLLYHRQVTIFDIFVSRLVLEVAQNVTAAAIVYAIFYLLGGMEAPKNWPMLVVGYLYMIWWCACVGLILGALSERGEWVEKLWAPYSYTYLFYCGMWYMAAWLPEQARGFALLQPSLQAYEMIRAGLLGDSVKTYYDFGYTSLVLGTLTLGGLWALRDGRKYVVAGG